MSVMLATHILQATGGNPCSQIHRRDARQQGKGICGVTMLQIYT